MDPAQQLVIETELESARLRSRKVKVSKTVLSKISDWYHVAILQLPAVEGIELTPAGISNELGIPESTAEAALECLLHTGLLEQSESREFSQTKRIVLVSARADDGLRKLHSQMLDRTRERIFTQLPDEKVIGTETLSFSTNHLPLAKEIIEDCLDKIAALSNREGRKDAVFHLGIQFFQLTKNVTKGKKGRGTSRTTASDSTGTRDG